MRDYIRKSHPLLAKNFKIIENRAQLHTLANMNIMIRKHCDQDDIIYDISPGNIILGRQFFKVLNAVYQQKGYWLVYSNYCMLQEELMKGYSKPIPEELLADHSYRRKAFVTIGARSFLRKLYMKINEKEFQNVKGDFYTKIGDGFIYVALAELAGVNHSYFIRETPYLYNTDSVMNDLELKKENAYIMKSKTPFQTLASLDD